MWTVYWQLIITSAFFVTVRASTAYRKTWRLVNNFLVRRIRFTVQKFQLFWVIFCITIFFHWIMAHFNFAALQHALSTIPISSSECERGFSQMNLIATPSRASLLTKIISSLLFVRLVGPPLKLFDPTKYVDSWILRGRRSAIDRHCDRRQLGWNLALSIQNMRTGKYSFTKKALIITFTKPGSVHTFTINKSSQQFLKFGTLSQQTETRVRKHVLANIGHLLYIHKRKRLLRVGK